MIKEGRQEEGVRRTRFVLAQICKGPVPGQVNPLFGPKVAVIRKEHILELAHPATLRDPVTTHLLKFHHHSLVLPWRYSNSQP